MALTFAAIRLFPPDNPGGTGRAELDIAGVSGPITVEVSLNPPTGPVLQQFSYAAPVTALLVGLAVGTTYFVRIRFAGPPAEEMTTTLTAPAFVLPPPTLESRPPALTAAHLPVLALLRATPTGDPLTPALLLLVIEVNRAGVWQPAGQLAERCDNLTGLARCNLSAYLNTQFSPTAPSEDGQPDPALAVPYRVRYGRLADFDGTPGAEAGTFSGLAVNAAAPVNPAGLPLPLPLGPAAPYASVPPGYARYRTTVNADGTGLVNVPALPEAAADWPCAVRQFVWLSPEGAWAWGFFSGRHEHGTETGEPTTVRGPGGVERYADAGEPRDTLRVYSDVLDWPAYQVLRGVRRSVQVYERLASGAYVPVLVERGAFAEYRETDKVFEVNFTVRYPLAAIQTQ